jgi:hypothetical protein
LNLAKTAGKQLKTHILRIIKTPDFQLLRPLAIQKKYDFGSLGVSEASENPPMLRPGPGCPSHNSKSTQKRPGIP